MINNYILMTDFVTNLQVKFLEEKEPSNEMGLRVGLLQKILQYGISDEDDHLGILGLTSTSKISPRQTQPLRTLSLW